MLRKKITGSFGLLPLRMTGVRGIRMTVKKTAPEGRNRFWLRADYEVSLELVEEFVDFFRNPSVLPVAVVEGSPLVRSIPAAELDREAFVNCREVVAEMSAATDFLRLFSAGIGEVAICVGLTVVLEDALECAVTSTVVLAGAVIFAVDGHPSDRQALVLRQVDVVVSGCIDSDSAQAVLHILSHGVRDHGAEAKARHEHAAGVNAVVFFESRKQLVDELVVLVARYAPRHAIGIATRRNEDEFALGVEFLLAVVRRRMILVRRVVDEVFGVRAHAVHGEEQLVRFLVVVVLWQSEEVFAVFAADSQFETVAVFDTLGFLQLGSRAAALARGRIVFQGVAELECRCRRFDFLEFYVEGRVERAELHGERVETFCDKADGFACLSILHEAACMHAQGTAVATVGREFELLHGAADGNLRKVCTLGLDALAQVVRAGTLQRFLENLVAERVENLHLYRLRAALGIRKDAVVDADVSDGVPESRMDCHVRGIWRRDNFVFVDGEFALVVRRCGLAFLEEAYRGVLDGLAFFVRNGSTNSVGK